MAVEEIYVIKVRSKPSASRLFPSERRYSAITVGGLGAVHLLLGTTCVLLGVLDITSVTPLNIWISRTGGGIWLGIAAYIAGGVGILAWKRWYVDNNIRWFFISSSVAGLIAVLCIALTSASLAVTHELRNFARPHPELSTEVSPSASVHPESYTVSSSFDTTDFVTETSTVSGTRYSKRSVTEEGISTSEEQPSSSSMYPSSLDVDDSMDQEESFAREKRSVSTVVSVNILVASALELAWCILSARIAWKGMLNVYPSDIDGKSDEEHRKNVKKEGAVLATAELKPDILCNHARNGSVNPPAESHGPSLPMEESSMEYQERVRRFLESHKLGS